MTPWLVVAVLLAVLLAGGGYVIGWVRGLSRGCALVWEVIDEAGSVIISRATAARYARARARLEMLAPAARRILNASPKMTRAELGHLFATIETALDGKGFHT